MQKNYEKKPLKKALTGITGFDEITDGGLPHGRASLICGNAGCGKTVFGMEFLVHGALECGEPGVFVSFEETSQDLVSNFAGLGYDLGALEHQKLLSLEYVYLDPAELIESGEFNLDGLFIRLQQAIDALGARRITLDTIEILFNGLSNKAVLRAELRRLFRWFKEKGLTALVTGEAGQGSITRNAIEEYVADCVILLDLRVERQIATRRLRIVKYRGSTILVSGTAGSGKSSVLAAFIDAACRQRRAVHVFRIRGIAFPDSA